jgi:Tfp pilus assembly protein PilX
MISHAHRHLTEPASRGFGRATGYTLIVIVAVLLLVALLSNPVLP